MNLRENGATAAECEFLVSGGHPKAWHGQRVELNAMTSNQFVAWLERKLKEVGAAKVIPDGETLEATYRRAVRIERIQKAIDEATKAADGEIAIPDELADRVKTMLAEHRELAWDEAIWRILGQANHGGATC